MELAIAVAQVDVEENAPEVNLAKAEEFVKAAAGEAAVIVFPENFVQGHVRGNEELVDFEGRYRERFRELARTHEIDIVPGSIVEGERRGWFNTTYYIDSGGTVKARYRKINLFLSEADNITHGNEVAVAETPHGRVGLAICWDLAFPEIFRRMAAKGAQIVFCPSYWSYEDAGPGLEYDREAEIKFVDSLCVARAFENEMCVVFCNPAGERKREGSTQSIGHSQIALPFVGAVKKLAQREEMFVERVDTAILDVAEEAYKIRRDLATRILW